MIIVFMMVINEVEDCDDDDDILLKKQRPKVNQGLPHKNLVNVHYYWISSPTSSPTESLSQTVSSKKIRGKESLSFVNVCLCIQLRFFILNCFESTTFLELISFIQWNDQKLKTNSGVIKILEEVIWDSWGDDINYDSSFFNRSHFMPSSLRVKVTTNFIIIDSNWKVRTEKHWCAVEETSSSIFLMIMMSEKLIVMTFSWTKEADRQSDIKDKSVTKRHSLWRWRQLFYKWCRSGQKGCKPRVSFRMRLKREKQNIRRECLQGKLTSLQSEMKVKMRVTGMMKDTFMIECNSFLDCV